jgi:hypothetical protein
MEKKIVVSDQNLLSQVAAAGGRAELCDPSGHTLGILLTAAEYRQMRRDAGEVEFTPEYLAEVDRSVAEGRYKTTAEVLELLGRLDKALAGDA